VIDGALPANLEHLRVPEFDVISASRATDPYPSNFRRERSFSEQADAKTCEFSCDVQKDRTTMIDDLAVGAPDSLRRRNLAAATLNRKRPPFFGKGHLTTPELYSKISRFERNENSYFAGVCLTAARRSAGERFLQKKHPPGLNLLVPILYQESAVEAVFTGMTGT
jgi:hypothetical protein